MEWVNQTLSEFLGKDLTWSNYILSFLCLFFALVLRKIFDLYFFNQLKRLAAKTHFRYDDDFINAINPPISAAFFLTGVFFAVLFLDLPDEPYPISKWNREGFRVSLALLAVWATYRLTDVLAHYIGEKLGDQDEILQAQFFPLIRKSLRIFVIVVGGLLVVQNLGYSIGSLLAGLGIGGLAFALAAQDSLANLFGSIILLSDKTFKVGQWVTVDGVDGIIEEIGFRSTKIRTWGKSVVTIPNKTFANANIENWSEMSVRRVIQTLGLTYDTPPDKMKEFVTQVKEIIQNHSGVDPETIHVRFRDYSNSSLDVWIMYFTKSTGLAEHLEVKEEINFLFLELAEKIGVSYAFPSQSLYWGPGENPAQSTN